ncbi:hypothetical protein [Microvirga lotononidis]|uniref:hypothetical protein n=1 Tax=Microvirga lotononidis TaxID=864069 RepID=UPI000695C33C|nr:hypothetical protein [Microvirga lotononidis]WQO26280.1 hypothetical protein U0023_16450 [Microvirga lotononidis]
MNVENDLVLWQALEVAHPSAKVDYNREGSNLPPCVSPYTLLSYDTFMVLLLLAGEPGEACHGCGASVSAVFLQRDGSRLKLAGRHDGFTEAGTFGDLMSINPLRLGSHDGIMVEGGGTFQGYSSSVLTPFLILNGRMKPIGPENGISSGDSDCGARDGPCRDVAAYWRTQGGRLIVRYVGKRANRSRINGSVVYELRKGMLVRVSGHKLAADIEGSRP